jgi:hypothetical protein
MAFLFCFREALARRITGQGPIRVSARHARHRALQVPDLAVKRNLMNLRMGSGIKKSF